MSDCRVRFDADHATDAPDAYDGGSTLSVTVTETDLALAEGDTPEEKAVDAALDILYEAPAFDWLSDYEVGEMDALSVTEIDSAEA